MRKFQSLNCLLILALLVSCDFTPRINKTILKAQDLIKDQKIKEALEVYEDSLRSDLDVALRIKILYQTAELYSIYIGDQDKSLRYFNEIKQITANPVWLVKVEEKLGEIYFDFLKDYKNAIHSYKSLVNFNPKLSKADYYDFRLALSYLNNLQYEKALEHFDLIIKNPNHEYYLRSLYHAGLVHYLNRNYQKATELFREFIKRESRRDKTVQARFLLASSYESVEDLQRAYSIYYSLLSEYPNTEVVRERLKSIYSRRVSRKR
jgi:tetratricopeptide (TPR) repeat protein